MVWHIIRANILLIARIFPRPCEARKNTTQLAKYPHVLYAKPSNKVYLLPSRVINSRAHSFRIILGSQKLFCFWTFRYPVPDSKNCVIVIGCNFESRASQVGLHKQKKDTASAKEGKVSLLRRGGQNPRRGGGYFRNFWVRMCCWYPGTLNLYQS